MGALYLAPLDFSMDALPGIRYVKFMEGWVNFAKTRWHFRRAVRVMNRVLAHLGLEQHPDKTFIGRVSRGFDFMGVDFQPGAPLAPSAVSLARKKEKIARPYEQGASLERIGRYDNHWQRWLHSLLGHSTPTGITPSAPIPSPALQRSVSHISPPCAPCWR